MSRKGPLVPFKVQVPEDVTVAAADVPEGLGYSVKVPSELDQVADQREIVIHIRFSYKAIAFVVALLLQVVYVYGHAIAQGIGFVP